jgi:hypothetical protein
LPKKESLACAARATAHLWFFSTCTEENAITIATQQSICF